MQESAAGGVIPAISQGQDTVDISKEAIDMLTSATAFKANLATLRAADEMSEEALKIKG
jgi:flagellar hook protein FlgE